MTSTPSSAATGDAARHHARRWWILATVALAQLMVVLDATIVNIAMPSAQADLGFSDNDRQWIVTAYALAFGSLLLLGGRLSDILGRRRTFLVGLVGFAVASAIGGASQSFEMLVAARALQGVFAAVLAPSALAVLTTTFTEPKERGRAFGVFGAIAGMGGAVGLLLGGYLTENFDWRWNLYVNLFFAAIAVVAGLVLLPRDATKRAAGAPRQSLDVPGVLLGSAGLFALVYGFSQAEPQGWDSVWTWGPLAASAVLLVAFVLWQRRTTHPLLPLPVVVDRDRGSAYVAILVAGSGMFGVFLFLTYYLQSSMGYSPMTTGFAFLPMVLAIIVTAQVSNNVTLPRFGPKVLVPIGLTTSAVGMLWFTQLAGDSAYASGVMPGLILMGIGMGCTMPPAFQLATLGVDRRYAGVASAMVSTSQQVGGAIGTAVLNTLAATAATSYVTDHAPATPQVMADAAIHSYDVAYLWSAAFFLVGAVVVAFLFRTKDDRAERLATAEAETSAPVVAH
ncbi:EmrB/QacA subfamily drug resistance transporter [Sediminihabitans luteus]|uniref:EmrB/QacA subfamily drug resistance transporter n=1 Tax=Sediminihabitans luteus TaxID=1138585 RepID=A0A2M9CDG0_9CELL|nr:MFS transporter [Sediminihabitans luteus]PJJ69933.1 EmrB/QacA subfamily drug resistance transporter [Sediminihabitans luteus]GII99253.1 MFS transporter [Sediminihabitans luteus]